MPLYNQPPSVDEQRLYDHLIACRKVESPDELLDRFRALFVDGLDYPDPQVLASLQRLTKSRLAEEHFKYVLNRCTRILINFWWFQPSFRWAIAELVHLLQPSSSIGFAQPSTQRLRLLLRQFLHTEEYQALQRLAQVVEAHQDMDSSDSVPPNTRHLSRATLPQNDFQPRSLRALIHRYPYLYPYCLGEQNGSETEFETIRHLQAERQKKYERDLSRYVTYLVQQAQGVAKTQTTVQNPTLLSDGQLKATIRHFTGKIEGASGYRALARRFAVFITQQQSYRGFKEGLYRYLVASIDAANPNYGEHHFHLWLRTQLKNTLPQSDTQAVSNFLVTRTCHQLIESLIASPQQVSNHFVFVDLVTNVGATVVVGLLLKLLLLFGTLKSALERRLAMLYKHYESVADGMEWLVESLENLQLAFAIHFSSMDLPCMSQL